MELAVTKLENPSSSMEQSSQQPHTAPHQAALGQGVRLTERVWVPSSHQHQAHRALTALPIGHLGALPHPIVKRNLKAFISVLLKRVGECQSVFKKKE